MWSDFEQTPLLLALTLALTLVSIGLLAAGLPPTNRLLDLFYALRDAFERGRSDAAAGSYAGMEAARAFLAAALVLCVASLGVVATVASSVALGRPRQLQIDRWMTAHLVLQGLALASSVLSSFLTLLPAEFRDGDVVVRLRYKTGYMAMSHLAADEAHDGKRVQVRDFASPPRHVWPELDAEAHAADVASTEHITTAFATCFLFVTTALSLMVQFVDFS